MIKKLKHHKSGLFDFVRPEVVTGFETTWLVGSGHTPTMDFYFRSRQGNFLGYTEIDTIQLPDSSHPLWADRQSQLILVRDVPLPFLKQLLRSPDRPQQIIWFIDDDIPSAKTDKTLPKAYRHRLSKWYRAASPLLVKLCSQVWVSTPYLARKYQLPHQWILGPKQISTETKKPIRCFYHGSASHTQEWAFIRSFVEAVQNKYDNISFELIGDHQIYKKFRSMPRVVVLHPMRWENYQAMLATRSMDIGLAPLFDSPFNQARSHCKLLDIQRQAAIGIYSARFSSAEEIKSSNAGFIADDSLESWLSAFDAALNVDRLTVLENSTKLISHLDSL